VPTYSYRCASCSHAFDQYQAFTDDTLTVCPTCGKSELRKVFNSIGVTFNGSGFYRTDSRAGSAKSESSSLPAEKAPAAAPAAPATAPASTTAAS
jgi:putative FmdB family regulatory protein